MKLSRLLHLWRTRVHTLHLLLRSLLQRRRSPNDRRLPLHHHLSHLRLPIRSHSRRQRPAVHARRGGSHNRRPVGWNIIGWGHVALLRRSMVHGAYLGRIELGCACRSGRLHQHALRRQWVVLWSLRLLGLALLRQLSLADHRGHATGRACSQLLRKYYRTPARRRRGRSHAWRPWMWLLLRLPLIHLHLHLRCRPPAIFLCIGYRHIRPLLLLLHENLSVLLLLLLLL